MWGENSFSGYAHKNVSIALANQAIDPSHRQEKASSAFPMNVVRLNPFWFAISRLQIFWSLQEAQTPEVTGITRADSSRRIELQISCPNQIRAGWQNIFCAGETYYLWIQAVAKISANCDRKTQYRPCWCPIPCRFFLCPFEFTQHSTSKPVVMQSS